MTHLSGEPAGPGPRGFGLVVALALALGAIGCVQRTLPLSEQAERIRVEHYRPNRCGDAPQRSCRNDSDCRKGPCVSTLLSDAGAFGRDAGHTIAVGDRVLWLFGDSFAAGGMFSMTAGWSDAADPLTLTDATVSPGAAIQFLPFTDSELSFNASHSDPTECCRDRADCPKDEPYCHCPPGTDCSTRMALWPGDGAEVTPGTATFYYERQIVGVAPYDFYADGVGVATVESGEAPARRKLDNDGEPLWLFKAGEPHFSRGLRVDHGDESFFYAYAAANRSGCAVDVLAARVPLQRMDQRQHFRFWNGEGWSAELADARPILRSIPGGLGSVSWNDHLERYLSVWSDICTGGNELVLRTAPAPEGPWSAAVAVDLAALGADDDAYYGMAHPELGRGRELLVSYFQPAALLDGQLRLLRLILP